MQASLDNTYRLLSNINLIKGTQFCIFPFLIYELLHFLFNDSTSLF